MTIPLRAHFISLQGRSDVVTSGWERRRLTRVLAEANGIWEPADIRFGLRSALDHTFELPGEDNTVVDRSAFFFLASRLGRNAEPSLALVRSVSRREVGGQAAVSLNFCLLPSEGSVGALGKQLAHEFGHLLGLGHPDGARDHTTASHREGARHVYNLMYSGLSADTRLTADQIREARTSELARRFEGS